MYNNRDVSFEASELVFLISRNVEAMASPPALCWLAKLIAVGQQEERLTPHPGIVSQSLSKVGQPVRRLLCGV